MLPWSWLGLVAVGLLVAMKTRNKAGRETRTRFWAFLLVTGFVAVLVLYKSYNWVGTLWNPEETKVELPELKDESRIGSMAQVHGPRLPLRPAIFYGIMFDAGSTGSRIHAMKFHTSAPGKPFKFVDEMFEQIKPGLSSYAKDPAKAGESLVVLLDKAMKYIPQHLHADTPIALKATAGLRLLQEMESQAILDHVMKRFKKYPFQVFNDSVQIMGGMDEGIFSWFTLNFFLEKLQNIKSTMGVMDLGGGSTQVTFVPQETMTLKEAPKGFLTEIDVFGKKHQLYTHSYLGLGLMSARLQMLGGKGGQESPVLESPCLAPGYQNRWSHMGKEYNIRGSLPGGDPFTKCYQVATKVIEGRVTQAQEIQHDPFTMISYYFDRAVDAHIIDEGSEGKNLTVKQYFNAAKSECRVPTKNKPFLCLDLTYISALLQQGFGFKEDTTLMVVKRIHGREISWALGAMFNFFNNHKLKAVPAGR